MVVFIPAPVWADVWIIGIVFSWKGAHRAVEREPPFDADEVVQMATDWANRMENSGLPRGWSYDEW